MAGRGKPTVPQLTLDLGRGEEINVHPVDEADEHGEVFTRRWVVELILDLAGYTSDRDLGGMVAVEPSCGPGAFLVPMTERLIESCHRHGRPLSDVGGALRAYDVLPTNVELAQKAMAKSLADEEVEEAEARSISTTCVRAADFLLAEHDVDADFVLGNPPYIRLEGMPAARSAEYRRACPTMRGRSDIFVGFIERGLRMLRPDGVLGFIVADRWMHNQYGTHLRRFVAEGYAVEAVLSMHDVDAFEEQVAAYPAITVIRRSDQRAAIAAKATKDFGEAAATTFARWAGTRSRVQSTKAVTAARLPGWFATDESSWPSGNPANLALLAELERRFAPLEDPATGTKVGIGVATGNDSVYLTGDRDLVEPERLLPVLTTRDTVTGVAKWTGTFLVNPWENGRLVALQDYPRLARYLESRSGEVRGRHVAIKHPAQWHRTIDRVDPTLLGRHKLVIPDLKAHIHPVLDRGETYPHHSFYVVTSDDWDLEVLGGLLLSDIAELFVAMYCVRMRGGCYRFQAQYLRRIRVPEAARLSGGVQRELATAFRDRDRDRASAAARTAYGISPSTRLATP